MPTTNPRVHVTFNQMDAAVLQLICQKRKMTMSGLVRRVIEDWIEDYEDMLLARRAEEILDKWEKDGRKSISHEEMWERLDAEPEKVAMRKRGKDTVRNPVRTRNRKKVKSNT